MLVSQNGVLKNSIVKIPDVDFVAPADEYLQWTPWIPLGGRIYFRWPMDRGLYRIRIAGTDDRTILYIGQTGRSVRQRVATLFNVFSQGVPRSSHHVAYSLWRIRQFGVDFDYDVSMIALPAMDTARRMGLETLALARYREQRGCSTALNFGRMPIRNRRKIEFCDRSGHYGVAPLRPLGGDPLSKHWAGYSWSDWFRLTDDSVLPPASEQGLYRLRGYEGSPYLLYIGQGRLRSRLRCHFVEMSTRSSRRGASLATAWRLEASYAVIPAALPSQRLEMECDLIGSYIVATNRVPTLQYLRDDSPSALDLGTMHLDLTR